MDGWFKEANEAKEVMNQWDLYAEQNVLYEEEGSQLKAAR